MALSIDALHTLVATNLADNSNIVPSVHREVEDEIINYMATLSGGGNPAPGSIPNAQMYTVIKYIESWQADKQYEVLTDISTGQIVTVHLDLECKSSNNGFSQGDIIDTPRAYPEDSGRTAAQGMGVQYRANTVDKVYVSTNDGVWAMSSFAGVGQPGGNFNVGASSSSWRIRVVITYIN